MADVSFYYVQKPPLDRVLVKILEKAYTQKEAAVVVVEASEEYLETLNIMLWTYSPGSFLPHGTQKEAEKLPKADQEFYISQQPIWLTQKIENPNQASLLILMEQKEPTQPEAIPLNTFKRIAFVIDAQDPEQMHYIKEQVNTYKQNHKVVQWQQSAEGAWAALE